MADLHRKPAKYAAGCRCTACGEAKSAANRARNELVRAGLVADLLAFHCPDSSHEDDGRRPRCRACNEVSPCPTVRMIEEESARPDQARRIEDPATPASANLASQVRLLRAKLDWSQADLAARLEAHGIQWDTSIVSKVEKGKRQVAVDEVVALAYVLGVSPLSLLIPVGWQGFKVTPNTTIHTSGAWDWAAGSRRPLAWGPMGLRKDRTPDPEGLVSLTDIAAAAVAGDL